MLKAHLRMDTSLTQKAKSARVQEVLTQMGLKKCENSRIGVSGVTKTISGGEMKRLSFASEVTHLFLCLQVKFYFKRFLFQQPNNCKSWSDSFIVICDLGHKVQGFTSSWWVIKISLKFNNKSSQKWRIRINQQIVLAGNRFFHILRILSHYWNRCSKFSLKFSK